MKRKGILTVVSGFSGAGKGTVMKALMAEYKDTYALSVSATTRNPRPGEVDGVDYFFRTREEFEQMIADNALIEHACYVGNYYGTPKAYVDEQLEAGKDVILEIEIQGALDVKKRFPDTILIFVTPPDADELKNRLVNRGTEDMATINARLSRASQEAEFMNQYDYIVVNDTVPACVENIHSITSPSGLAASVSIGLGVDGSCFEEAYNFAALGIEMALSRGGDQAVIKDRMNFTFFGGRSVEAEYSSKVRSRVTAGSLMELIGQSSQVFVMGHSNADLDSLGAAMGICCLCRKKGKPANIVIDLEHNSTTKLISQVLKVPEYEGVFISGQEAMVACDKGSVLVVVDTNRPDKVEFKPLLEAINKVCVVDHHRRAADYISPVVLDLHETYASSASELVTELLIYGVDSSDVLPIEAKALLAGICMDTKFFNVRTGERTFEAAAALRRMGADTTEVKKLMQNDFQDTMAKYQIIKSSRLYRQEIAIAALNTPTTRVLAAQAADELLNISGITASFVLYPDGEQVIISARSIGSANVQMILEPLGGGGNTATAGAQMKDTTVKEALDELVASIDAFVRSDLGQRGICP